MVTVTTNAFCTIIHKLTCMIFVIGCAKFGSYFILFGLIWMLLVTTQEKFLEPLLYRISLKREHSLFGGLRSLPIYALVGPTGMLLSNSLPISLSPHHWSRHSVWISFLWWVIIIIFFVVGWWVQGVAMCKGGQNFEFFFLNIYNYFNVFKI